jgi:hypothetical protein
VTETEGGRKVPFFDPVGDMSYRALKRDLSDYSPFGGGSALAFALGHVHFGLSFARCFWACGAAIIYLKVADDLRPLRRKTMKALTKTQKTKLRNLPTKSAQIRYLTNLGWARTYVTCRLHR